MLAKIEIENFKNFKEKFIFDLSKPNGYTFNKECIKNNLINKALIYGYNASGKSNLGFAIFDLIGHLTDKNPSTNTYKNYLNADSDLNYAKFTYYFIFKNISVVYSYTKKNYETLLSESLVIDNKEYASIDRNKSNKIEINISGAETLNRDIGDSKISIISYIKNNAILDENQENLIFADFIDFINKMLFFRSLDENKYIGFEQGSNPISSDIIEHGNTKDFELFLNKVGIDCKIKEINVGTEKELAFSFKNKDIPFYDIASQGTKALTLFYYWHQRLKDKKSDVKFVFIDEFDAFYHHDLSTIIIEMLKEIDAQVIMTTHNVAVMTNDLLRPDCYFFIKDNKIGSLSNLTEKELREAHNIEKMYKAGAFVI